MTPFRIAPEDAVLADVLALIRVSFAYMDGRIDPPSSVHRLSLERLRDTARDSEIWAMGGPPVACVILTGRPDALYLGKLAVAQAARGTGLARRLVALAETRARALGLARLELETRIELVENQATFARLGFQDVARTAHPGYDRPTSVTMRKTLSRL
ncbi:MAG: GNAT family N-acetyltransferase [Pseudomonadota bacterium]